MQGNGAFDEWTDSNWFPSPAERFWVRKIYRLVQVGESDRRSRLCVQSRLLHKQKYKLYEVIWYF